MVLNWGAGLSLKMANWIEPISSTVFLHVSIIPLSPLTFFTMAFWTVFPIPLRKFHPPVFSFATEVVELIGVCFSLSSVQGYPKWIWSWPVLTGPHLSKLTASCFHSSFHVLIHSIPFSLILRYLGWVARSSNGGAEDLVMLVIDNSQCREAQKPVQCKPLIILIKCFL